MSLHKPIKELDVDGQRIVLRRPGRGGIERLHRRLAASLSDAYGGVNGALLELDGEGIEMAAVLHEYLVEGPDEWRARDRAGKVTADERGRPLWDFEDAEIDLFGRVGQEAVAFHRSFRGFDARFRAGAGSDEGGAKPLAAAADAPAAR